MGEAVRSRDRWFYWISAKEPETGKEYLIAGGRTEEEARIKGLECLPGIDFEIKKLNTTSLSEASHKLKGSKLERTHSLKKASEKMYHQKTIERDRQRRSRREERQRRASSF